MLFFYRRWYGTLLLESVKHLTDFLLFYWTFVYYIYIYKIYITEKMSSSPPPIPSTSGLMLGMEVQRTPQGSLKVVDDVLLERSASGHRRESRPVKLIFSNTAILFYPRTTWTFCDLSKIFSWKTEYWLLNSNWVVEWISLVREIWICDCKTILEFNYNFFLKMIIKNVTQKWSFFYVIIPI